jgi:ABC-type Fe3+-hydroxamate transport system substrate-binding protein
MKKLLVVIAIVAAAAACGGGSSVPTSSLPSSDGTTGKPVIGGPVPQSGGSGGSTDQGNPVTSAVPTLQGPQVIRQAQLTISVGSQQFATKLADVRALVQLQGGFISGTDAQANPVSNDQIRTGVITFMVPAAKFDDTINQLSQMGKIQNEHISGNDVSAQYVDLQARLANQMAQRDAMLVLLKRAQSIQDIITVQNQIGQITGQIEQLKGQIQYIEHNTSYSTVTVTMLEAGAPAQVARQDSWGFATALSDGAHNFVTTINYVVTGLGAIGPVLVLLGLGYLLWRRSGRPGWPVAKHA